MKLHESVILLLITAHVEYNHSHLYRIQSIHLTTLRKRVKYIEYSSSIQKVQFSIQLNAKTQSIKVIWL